MRRDRHVETGLRVQDLMSLRSLRRYTPWAAKRPVKRAVLNHRAGIGEILLLSQPRENALSPVRVSCVLSSSPEKLAVN